MKKYGSDVVSLRHKVAHLFYQACSPFSTHNINDENKTKE
ncbi:hypothetical protein STRINF_00748 [Streptococcus infantarius subsp. infantarius ATCC BAA-102]|uniref:Uncharacterized protein n=1 Tax=Streptococcus infantarius subsp. infantarius ATCC BAA-102 TaxID=471872 RepID=A0ABM9XF35_9STRE|nr:hypothetical protein STRINF_00748 [Streptococcus infantarius subsp. infantarius ATCC BAA-102]